MDSELVEEIRQELANKGFVLDAISIDQKDGITKIVTVEWHKHNRVKALSYTMQGYSEIARDVADQAVYDDKKK